MKLTLRSTAAVLGAALVTFALATPALAQDAKPGDGKPAPAPAPAGDGAKAGTAEAEATGAAVGIDLSEKADWTLGLGAVKADAPFVGRIFINSTKATPDAPTKITRLRTSTGRMTAKIIEAPTPTPKGLPGRIWLQIEVTPPVGVKTYEPVLFIHSTDPVNPVARVVFQANVIAPKEGLLFVLAKEGDAYRQVIGRLVEWSKRTGVAVREVDASTLEGYNRMLAAEKKAGLEPGKGAPIEFYYGGKLFVGANVIVTLIDKALETLGAAPAPAAGGHSHAGSSDPHTHEGGGAAHSHDPAKPAAPTQRVSVFMDPKAEAHAAARKLFLDIVEETKDQVVLRTIDLTKAEAKDVLDKYLDKNRPDAKGKAGPIFIFEGTSKVLVGAEITADAVGSELDRMFGRGGKAPAGG